MITKAFLGLDCVEFTFDEINLLATRSVGPRILSLEFKNSSNIFAELPDQYLEFQNGKKYNFFGGHRLWSAPEIPEITYSPENTPVEVSHENGIVSMVKEADPVTGIRKEIRIQPSRFENTLIIDHVLKNESEISITIAPWAITQLKVEGTAILPFNESVEKENPYLPNRSLILWPYSDLYDKRISYSNEYIVVHSALGGGPLKLGIPNSQNWLAYLHNNILFVKITKNHGKNCELDMGAAGQCYCNDKFIELESLGRLKTLSPGDDIGHREIWKLAKVNIDDDIDNFQEFLPFNSWMDMSRDLL
jgi:hypothetical protein